MTTVAGVCTKCHRANSRLVGGICPPCTDGDPEWTPFERGVIDTIPDPVLMAQKAGVTVEEVVAALTQRIAEDEVWLNSRYQVNINRTPTIIHVSVKRLDKGPIHDWRDMQRIKNELVGPEHEGVELYPAESRLVDTSNQYHMWVFAQPDARFPFGFNERLVSDSMEGTPWKQRPLGT